MGSETSSGFNVRLLELADGPFRGSNVPQNVRCEGLSHERVLLRRLVDPSFEYARHNLKGP